MSRWIRPSWLVLIAACAPTASDVARDTFAAAYRCPSEAVRARPDLEPLAYEAIGCGRDVIYACTGAWGDPATYGSDHPPACTPTTWCARPGCTTDDRSAALARFAIERACPAEQVTATRGDDPATPPTAVARDPARLAAWRQAEVARAAGAVFVIARGCDATAIYECRDRPPELPDCVGVPGAGPP